jgi:FkbM family methyltransferase
VGNSKAAEWSFDLNSRLADVAVLCDCRPACNMSRLGIRTMTNILKEVANSKRIRKYFWSIFGRPRRVALNGVIIDLDCKVISDRVARSMFLQHYERAETAVVLATLAAGDRILELGAGIGYMSTLCAKKVGSEHVNAVEANPAMEAKIRRTYELNHVSPNLEICVLGDSDGETTFHVADNYSSSSVHDRGGRPVTVRQRSFAGLLADLRPTYLICDIEGAEVPLLVNTALDGIRKICIEIHPHIIGDKACSQLVRKLLSEGFALNCDRSGGRVYFFYRDP